jgi:hypothetical protein
MALLVISLCTKHNYIFKFVKKKFIDIVIFIIKVKVNTTQTF